MAFRIVSDSSINMTSLDGTDFKSIPMKILCGIQEFVDDADLDVENMVSVLSSSKEKSGTSCPNIMDWKDAFDGADEILAITISGQLSGSWSTCNQAMEEYLEEHPGAKGYVFDSLSTGPMMRCLAENAAEMMSGGMTFDEMIQRLQQFRRHATLIFALASMNNLAKNGRVPMAVAKAVGILNIRIIAVGDENGKIKPVDKCRGENKLPKILLHEMQERKYAGGHVHIDHCLNLPLAERIRASIQEQYPGADVTIGQCRGLCSYYAEQGGVIIAFDDVPFAQEQA
ncbi:MAG: DegV family EDD domain-containing protein [Clostridiales bacterium]|nr:DegV family EDD domain-containing protein [Clostridiales bacterium]